MDLLESNQENKEKKVELDYLVIVRLEPKIKNGTIQ